ncbi:MAG: acyl-CoA dehydrogenase, partial [Alphaproteobacteria bacterium]|nr:acyl-CoA dehydrogenase [Alphaproteobacteria bacterium]
MFVMMNAARIGVGLQSLGLMEVAYQNSVAYARDRLQMRSLTGPKAPDKAADPIIVHPDVRRMLLTQRAWVEGSRAFAYWLALQSDVAQNHADAQERERAEGMLGLLTPVVKAFLTDNGFAATNMAMQVYGGHGFIREWGMEQYVRDARINMIYEGTNGIQALDLVGRKLIRDDGAAMRAWLDENTPLLTELEESHGADLSIIGERLHAGFDALRGATGALLARGGENNGMDAAGAVAHPYLTLAGHVMAGAALARGALAARALFRAQDTGGFSSDYLQSRITLARFFADHILPQVEGLACTVRHGADAILAARL